jgi:cytochrome b561
VGMTVMALALVRLLWRLTHRPPADPPMPTWQARVAHWTHGLLYALFFAVPLVGWAYSCASGYPVVVFGVLPLPDLLPKNPEWADTLKELHENVAWALAALVGLHLVAALKHHWVDKDGLLTRMWFGPDSRTQPSNTEPRSAP